MSSTSKSMAKRWIREGEQAVSLYPENRWSAIGVVAKVDTGADRTSVDQEICEALGWPVVSERTITNANGRSRRRIYSASFEINGSVFLDVEVTGSDCGHLSHLMLLGSDILQELLEILEEE